MKKKLLLLSVATATFLNAQVLPGINSKGGGMTLPAGKLKMVIKHIYETQQYV